MSPRRNAALRLMRTRTIISTRGLAAKRGMGGSSVFPRSRARRPCHGCRPRADWDRATRCAYSFVVAPFPNSDTLAVALPDCVPGFYCVRSAAIAEAEGLFVNRFLPPSATPLKTPLCTASTHFLRHVVTGLSIIGCAKRTPDNCAVFRWIMIGIARFSGQEARGRGYSCQCIIPKPRPVCYCFVVVENPLRTGLTIYCVGA